MRRGGRGQVFPKLGFTKRQPSFRDSFLFVVSFLLLSFSSLHPLPSVAVDEYPSLFDRSRRNGIHGYVWPSDAEVASGACLAMRERVRPRVRALLDRTSKLKTRRSVVQR